MAKPYSLDINLPDDSKIAQGAMLGGDSTKNTPRSYVKELKRIKINDAAEIIHDEGTTRPVNGKRRDYQALVKFRYAEPDEENFAMTTLTNDEENPIVGKLILQNSLYEPCVSYEFNTEYFHVPPNDTVQIVIRRKPTDGSIFEADDEYLELRFCPVEGGKGEVGRENAGELYDEMARSPEKIKKLVYKIVHANCPSVSDSGDFSDETAASALADRKPTPARRKDKHIPLQTTASDLSLDADERDELQLQEAATLSAWSTETYVSPKNSTFAGTLGKTWSKVSATISPYLPTTQKMTLKWLALQLGVFTVPLAFSLFLK